MCRRFQSAIEFTYRRQHSHFRKLLEELTEHHFAVDAIVETGLPYLYSAGDVVEILSKRKISVTPRDGLCVRYPLKPVFLCDRVPHRRFARHLGCQAARPCPPNLHAKHLSLSRPPILP